MLNVITLGGRLVAAPELKQTQSGNAVVSFRIACDRDGGKDKGTDFISVTAWRSTAEFISRFFQKGSMIYVSGRLQMRDYTDRDGNRRTAAEVVADKAWFGDSKGMPRAADDGDYSQLPAVDESGFSQEAVDKALYRGMKAASAFAEIEDDGELPF